MASKMLKNPKISEAIAKQHPLKRLGEGFDSAALAKFLISSKFILLYPVKYNIEYKSIEPCPDDKINRSLFIQLGFLGLNLR